jgi:hypothetical protein
MSPFFPLFAKVITAATVAACVAVPGWGQRRDKTTSDHLVLNLVPNRLKGFEQVADSKSSTMKIGTLQYSMCEKKFERFGQSIKVLLFDFKEAPIMYSQAMKTWGKMLPVESDSVVARNVVIRECNGWETYHPKTKTSQMSLGICDRFFLNLTGERVELETLHDALAMFDLENFPK